MGVLQVAPTSLKSTPYLLAFEYTVLAMPFVYRSLDATEADALSMAAHAMALVRTTSDSKEGPRAFMEKRAPRFGGA